MRVLWIFIMLSFLFKIFCGPPKPTELPKPNIEKNKRNFSEILKDLDSKDWNTRSLALAEITNGRYVEGVKEVRKFLKDPHPVVRGSAALALGEFQDKVSLPNIIQLLNDKDVPKDVIVDALRRMKEPSSAIALVPLLDSENASLRLVVVDALFELNNRSIGKDILKLAERNQDPEKDKTYAMILGKLEVKESEDYLLNLVQKEKNTPTLAAVFLALGKIKSKKAIPLLAQAIGEEFEKGRENASIALREMKDPTSLPYLYPHLRSLNKEIRYTTAEIISEIPSSNTIKVILEILNGTKKEFYGASCFVAGRLKLQTLRTRIEEILLDKSVPEREVIAQSLGWLGDSRSIDTLVKVLDEKDGEGKYGAAWALGFLEPTQVFLPLKKASQSKDFRLASIAIESIGHLKLEESIEVLEEAIDRDKNLAIFGLSSLGNIPGAKARKTLLMYAKSKEPEIYRPAIEVLGRRKEQESIKPLIAILKENNADKNRIIVSALNSITGKKFTTTTEWLNWNEQN